MIATSIGGSITGKGGSRIVVDDPHNPTQAESDAQREAALTYFQPHALHATRQQTRAMRSSWLCSVSTSAICPRSVRTSVLPTSVSRWKRRSRRPFVFRAVIGSSSGHPGELLWPSARRSADPRDRRHRLLGSAAYAGQYQQRPAPAGGLIFRHEWWRFYDELPPVSECAQSWDMAFKDTPSRDFVVGLVAGRKARTSISIDRVKGQWCSARAAGKS